MYRSVEDFLNEWQQESQSTRNLLQHLTDASLAQRIDAEGWTLGRIAWHLAAAPGELMRIAETPIDAPSDDATIPCSAAEIALAYERMAEALAQQVRADWTDAILPEEVSAYGQTWSRGELLTVLLRHQTHHRGQLTVLARQAGLVIPGVCGPSREEMAALMAQFAEASKK